MDKLQCFTRWSAIALLAPLCLASWSCSLVGKGIAGGPGDGKLFDNTPPVPSVPVVPGTYSMQISAIATNPVAPAGFQPQRYDRFAAVRDTETLIVGAGSTSNTITLRSADLDPRADDTIFLQDRGGNRWQARVGGSSPFLATIETDGAGVPLQYILQMVSTPVLSPPDDIMSKRTFDRVPNAIIDTPGLKYCRVRTSKNAPLPPAPGDFFDMIVDSRGIAQWEQDTFEQRYRWNPLIARNEAQHTTYADINPPNVEHYDVMDTLPPPLGSGTNHEFNHLDGEELQWVDFSPPPAGGWIAPLDCSGRWHAKAENPWGPFGGFPYYLKHHLSDVVMTVDSPHLTATVDANCTWDGTNHMVKIDGHVDVFHIIRLDHDHMVAVRAIAANTYDVLTLFRDQPRGAPALTPHTPGSAGKPVTDAKSISIERVSNGMQIGAYSLGGVSDFPLEWWP